MITEINEADFENSVIKSDIPVLVDFSASWCGTCRKLTPVLEEIGKSYEDKLKMVKINIDQNLNIAKEYSVSGLPSILIFKNGKPEERLAGLMPKSTIISSIEKHL
ncbi:thioredoxin [bacterium]|nr:thioredoxin [bacterium]